MEVEQMSKEREIRAGLSQFIGTLNYYRHFTGIKFTDGIKFLADKCGCYWLLDVVCSYQHKLKNVKFQIWSIKVNDDKSALVSMSEDTGQRIAVKQELEFTDFPLKEYEFYLIEGVILLKSEY